MAFTFPSNYTNSKHPLKVDTVAKNIKCMQSTCRCSYSGLAVYHCDLLDATNLLCYIHNNYAQLYYVHNLISSFCELAAVQAVLQFTKEQA